jgi:hypothetical protein
MRIFIRLAKKDFAAKPTLLKQKVTKQLKSILQFVGYPEPFPPDGNELDPANVHWSVHPRARSAHKALPAEHLQRLLHTILHWDWQPRRDNPNPP